MKTYSKIIMYVAAGIILSGCAKESLEVEKTPITIDASNDDNVKLSLSGATVVWNTGDKITVYDSGKVSNEFTLQSGEGGESASFTGSITAETTAMYAAYPKVTLTAGTTDSYITAKKVSSQAILSGFELPRIQNAVLGGFESSAFPAIGKVTGEAGSYSVKFKNLAVLFKIVLPSISNLRSVTLCTASGAILSGTFAVLTDRMSDSDDYPYSILSRSFYPDVTLKKSDDSDIAAGTYYLAALPSTNGASMKYPTSRNTMSNMQILLTRADGTVAHKTLTGITLTKRSNVYTINLSEATFTWKQRQTVTLDLTTKPTDFDSYIKSTSRSKTNVTTTVNGHEFVFYSATGLTTLAKDDKTNTQYTDGWIGWWWSSNKYLENKGTCNNNSAAMKSPKAQFRIPSDFAGFTLYEVKLNSNSQDKSFTIFSDAECTNSVHYLASCPRQGKPNPEGAANAGCYSVFINRNSINHTGDYYLSSGHSGTLNFYNYITCIYEKDVTE